MTGAPWTTAPDGTPVPKVVSTTEAGALLGLTRNAVRDNCRRGRFPGAIKFANIWWVPLADVDQRHRRTFGRALRPAEVRAVVGSLAR